MKFGPVSVELAVGAIAAHSLKLSGGTVRKGTVIEPRHVAWARADGVDTMTVARLEAGDMHEDEAAKRIAEAVAGLAVRVDKAFTGRANLFAEKAGVLMVDAPGVNAVNRIDPAITVATLAQHRPVEPGRMVATVKIIPYAVRTARVYDALHALAGIGSLVDVVVARPMRVGVISTLLPGLKAATVEKTVRVLGERLAPAGATLASDLRVPHEVDAVAAAMQQAVAEGAELLVLFGASAVVDRADVLPAAIDKAGGSVLHFGMPVDPGNLLVLGAYRDRPVIGAPGCARSPRENGFDWVLQRILAGLNVTGEDLMDMGVGGLLMEIVSRPQPRAEPPPAVEPRVAAVILAAGRSRRMGPANKLVATLEGAPLVRHAAAAALASRCAAVTVVVGHEAEAVTEALEGLDVSIVHNPDHARGLSSSLQAGLRALGEDVDAAVVVLGDMPRIEAATIDRLIAAYDPSRSALVVVPTFQGRRGNPVLWSRRYFDELHALRGDAGARQLLDEFPEAVVEIEAGSEVAFDIDTPEALARAGGSVTD